MSQCGWSCSVTDTMQWTAIDVQGSAPECRLDFAACTLQLRLVASNNTKSCVELAATSSASQRHSGYIKLLHRRSNYRLAMSYSTYISIPIFYVHMYTVSGKKRGHVIFNYNSRILWSIFIIFIPLETGMNTPQLHVIYLLKIFVTS